MQDFAVDFIASFIIQFLLGVVIFGLVFFIAQRRVAKEFRRGKFLGFLCVLFAMAGGGVFLTSFVLESYYKPLTEPVFIHIEQNIDPEIREMQFKISDVQTIQEGIRSPFAKDSFFEDITLKLLDFVKQQFNIKEFKTYLSDNEENFKIRDVISYYQTSFESVVMNYLFLFRILAFALPCFLLFIMYLQNRRIEE